MKGLDVDLDVALASCLSDPELYQRKGALSDPNGWVPISLLGTALRRLKPEWDVRNFGVSKSTGLAGLLKLPKVAQLYQLQKTKASYSLRAKART